MSEEPEQSDQPAQPITPDPASVDPVAEVAIVEPPAPGIRRSAWIAMILLAFLGLGISAFLWYSTASNSGLPGCGGPGPGEEAKPGGWIDCEHVLASRYSKFFGQPVSMPATLVYAILVVLLLGLGPRVKPEKLRHFYPLLLLLTGGAAGAALWFVGLQVLYFKAICLYCMTAHACSLALFALAIGQAPIRRGTGDGTPHLTRMSLAGALMFSFIGLLGATALPMGVGPEIQVTHEIGIRPNTSEGHGKDRALTMMNGTIRVKPADMPLIGSPDAPNIIIDLFDYTCPHCRIMHQYLVDAQKRFGDQMAIIPLAVPMDSECNPAWKDTQERHKDACKLAKLGLVVWRLKPEKMPEFDDWMFEPENPRPYLEARTHAAKLIGGNDILAGEDLLAKTLEDPWITSRIKGNIVFYELTGGGSIPKLVSGNLILAGQPGTPEHLFDVFERDLNMKPPAGAESQPGK